MHALCLPLRAPPQLIAFVREIDTEEKDENDSSVYIIYAQMYYNIQLQYNRKSQMFTSIALYIYTHYMRTPTHTHTHILLGIYIVCVCTGYMLLACYCIYIVIAVTTPTHIPHAPPFTHLSLSEGFFKDTGNPFLSCPSWLFRRHKCRLCKARQATRHR